MGVVASQFSRREVPVQTRLYFNEAKCTPAEIQKLPEKSHQPVLRSFKQKKTVLRSFLFLRYDEGRDVVFCHTLCDGSQPQANE